jgi:hypothetical protein
MIMQRALMLYGLPPASPSRKRVKQMIADRFELGARVNRIDYDGIDVLATPRLKEFLNRGLMPVRSKAL